MVAKPKAKSNSTKQEPFRCPICGAMVFTIEKLHGPLCYLYRESASMVDGSNRYYEKYKTEKDAEQAELIKQEMETKKNRVGKGRKQIAKDTGL